MSTTDNLIKSRLLTYAADCYARGWDEAGWHLVAASTYLRSASRLQGDGRTWAQWQSSTWGPYKSESAAAWGWAFAILHALVTEEAAP